MQKRGQDIGKTDASFEHWLETTFNFVEKPVRQQRKIDRAVADIAPRSGIDGK